MFSKTVAGGVQPESRRTLPVMLAVVGALAVVVVAGCSSADPGQVLL